MKTLFALGLTGMLGFLLFTMMHAGVPFAGPEHGSSQIYIHGTAVCVTQQGDRIVARVGECGTAGMDPGESYHGRIPFHGHPSMELPPGHPPIDGGLHPEENRRVLI